jgi:hypothetical protein
MGLYIPFIHKIIKKQKEKFVQIPLQIEEYDPFLIEKLKIDREEKELESVIIIDLS